MGQHVWMVVAIAVTVLVLLACGFLLRLRYLAGQVGSFECALRPRGAQRWLSGVASFQLDSLEWYRLVSFSRESSRKEATPLSQRCAPRGRRAHSKEPTCPAR